LLNFEISQQESTKKKIAASVNAQSTLQSEKDKFETQLVQMVANDIDH
jgi:hypothetical protein